MDPNWKFGLAVKTKNATHTPRGKGSVIIHIKRFSGNSRKDLKHIQKWLREPEKETGLGFYGG